MTWQAIDTTKQGLLISACDFDGACEMECWGEDGPQSECCRIKALAALSVVEEALEAAAAYDLLIRNPPRSIGDLDDALAFLRAALARAREGIKP